MPHAPARPPPSLRPLPPSLAALAYQLAAAVDALTSAAGPTAAVAPLASRGAEHLAGREAAAAAEGSGGGSGAAGARLGSRAAAAPAEAQAAVGAGPADGAAAAAREGVPQTYTAGAAASNCTGACGPPATSAHTLSPARLRPTYRPDAAICNYYAVGESRDGVL
jgi:hypothetical protein